MIPPILHQTWKERRSPRSLFRYVESWKRLHPGWQFELWTDADLADLVDSHCSEHSNLFHSYPRSVVRADLGRFWSCGNSAAFMPISIPKQWQASAHCWKSETYRLFAYEPQSHAALEFVRDRGFRSVVSNAVILSPAGHPFWDHLLQLMHRCRHATNPLDATGPFVLTAAFETSARDGCAVRAPCARVFSRRQIRRAR